MENKTKININTARLHNQRCFNNMVRELINMAQASKKKLTMEQAVIMKEIYNIARTWRDQVETDLTNENVTKS